ncbi:hypothetical protein GCM10010909_31380 [Acidocella aquatica]|uniref:DUF1214 domain-containing protein n=1 Tax=Acidocella aquatica TaxID=1922313 RepID=A0ABQ6AAY3_9PROT|nr:DUF1214 domain-containing protein [Acidocella aquatica]GLR68457.1 hypothetical protein GCM10010909_31380 [Acidocella aquatica]
MSEISTTAAPILKEAWERFHAAQQEVLGWMEDSSRFKDIPQHRAKAYHTMMEALAMCYNFAVAPRMHNPRLFVNTGWQTEMYTLGQNGPDLHYAVTFLDGRQTYRLTGNYGDCVLILAQVLNHLSGHPDSRAIGNYDFSTFEIGADGSFEFILSADEHKGNWIKLDRESPYHFLLFRRFMGDWNDKPCTMQLDRISEIADDYYDADEFDETAMAARIDRATEFLRYMIRDFNINLYEFYTKNGGGFNHMAFLPGTVTSQVGSPSSNYAMAVFDLAPDEALVIELDRLPDGVYWSLQAGDVWSRSLNFTYRQTSISMRHAAVDADGGFRAVVAHKDPGVANWIDTTGHLQGTVVFRNYRATREPVPSTRKVKFAELTSVLPAGTVKMTPAERVEALRKRRAGFLKLHGE